MSSLLQLNSPKSPINGSSKITTTNQLPVIPFQQTLSMHPIGKPRPNKRGRKPLTKMPLGKKHIQNLNNQRAFRQRKENYIRNLETRVSELEVHYSSAQNEIKSLKNKIEMLEKKLTSSRSIKNKNREHYGGIVGSVMYQAIIENPTSLYDENKDKSCNVITNDQINSKNKPGPFANEVVQDSNIYCEPLTTSPLYPTFITNSSQNSRNITPPQESGSQWILSAVTTTESSSHPLNLKWILSDNQNEE